MTTSNNTILIRNGDAQIEVPISALTHYDSIVELSHLVMLGQPVQQRSGNGGQDALKKVQEAMASDNPIEALRKMRDKLDAKSPEREDLKAEVIKDGEKPKDDPMVRIAEFTAKCAEGVGLTVHPDMPVQSLIARIATAATRSMGHVTQLEKVSQDALNGADMDVSEEKGFAGTAKNLMLLNQGLSTHIRAHKGGWKAVNVLKGTLGAFGIAVQDRPQGSLEQVIGDCQQALSLAAQRGHKLDSKTK